MRISPSVSFRDRRLRRELSSAGLAPPARAVPSHHRERRTRRRRVRFTRARVPSAERVTETRPGRDRATATACFPGNRPTRSSASPCGAESRDGGEREPSARLVLARDGDLQALQVRPPLPLLVPSRPVSRGVPGARPTRLPRLSRARILTLRARRIRPNRRVRRTPSRSRVASRVGRASAAPSSSDPPPPRFPGSPSLPQERPRRGRDRLRRRPLRAHRGCPRLDDRET